MKIALLSNVETFACLSCRDAHSSVGGRSGRVAGALVHCGDDEAEIKDAYARARDAKWRNDSALCWSGVRVDCSLTTVAERQTARCCAAPSTANKYINYGRDDLRNSISFNDIQIALMGSWSTVYSRLHFQARAVRAPALHRLQDTHFRRPLFRPMSVSTSLDPNGHFSVDSVRACARNSNVPIRKVNHF